jgi:serine beta-lactamase-like protein LACTB
MKNLFFSRSLIILIISGFLFSCRQKQEDPSIVRSKEYKESLEEIYPKLEVIWHNSFIPGMSVAVSIDNKIVWADGFGYSNSELKVKTLPSHKFRIGQATELITALTAAKLYESGKLPIDVPISAICPGFTQRPYNYTIRQIAAHASGIRAEKSEAGKGETNQSAKFIDSFVNDDLIYEPGTTFGHTELGFDLMGYVLEKSANMSFIKVVKETLIDPLNLDNTVQENLFRITDNKSSQYDFGFMAQPTVAKQINLQGREASVGYLSSVIDLVKMGNTLLYPGYLKQETIDMMTTPYRLTSGQSSKYGFGLIIAKDQEGRQLYGQLGGVTGGSAALLIFPAEKMVVAIAANIANETLELPVYEVAKTFMKNLKKKK